MSDQYLSAEALGISPEERAALVELVRYVPTVPHQAEVDSGDCVLGDSDAPAGVRFNMGFAGVGVRDCGTVACLGGHVSLLLQGFSTSDLKDLATTPEHREAIEDYVGQYLPDGVRAWSPLSEVYYPRCQSAYQATPEQSARATLNFLNKGYPSWVTVLREAPGDDA